MQEGRFWPGIAGSLSLIALVACSEERPVEPELCAYALHQAAGKPDAFTVSQTLSGGRKEEGRELVTIRVSADWAGGKGEAACTFERKKMTTDLMAFRFNDRPVEGDALTVLTALVDRKKWELSMKR